MMLARAVATLLAAVSLHAPAAVSCEWAKPGHDPYTGSRIAAIWRMGFDWLTTARLIVATMRAPDDRVVVWRDSITSTTHRITYTPALHAMSFGTARVCDITRASWSEFQAEPGSAWRVENVCVLQMDVCSNWAWTPCQSRPGRGAHQQAGAVPEPGVLWLVGMGLAAAVFIRSRLHRK